ncbi:MAG: 30S ribosomal protein S24e, partial [Candidatus Methanomethylophilaceae archaeon]
MKIEITQQKKNPLQKRNEVYFSVDHTGESTPKRNAVAEELAKMLKSKRDSLVIDHLDSVYGKGVSEGYAKVYESKEAALEFENEYLLKRNGIEAPKP